MRHCCILSVTVLACACASVRAAEPVLPPPTVPDPASELNVNVTATRLGDGLSTTSTSEIDADDMRRAGHRPDLAQQLNGLAGVAVQSTGGGSDGGISAVRIRGGRSSDTLMVLDGIPLGDAADANGRFDLLQLSAAGAESLRVTRGPLSGAYGSSAVTGVVDITTARPTTSNHASALIEAGSFGTARGEAVVTGPLGRHVGIAVSASVLRSDGLTSQIGFDEVGSGKQYERDAYDRSGASARIEVKPLEPLTLFVSGRADLRHGEFDGFAAPDDDVSKGSQRFLRTAAGAQWESPFIDAKVVTALSSNHRLTIDSFAVEDRYDSRDMFTAAQGTMHAIRPSGHAIGPAGSAWFERVDLTAGGDVRRERADIASQFGELQRSARQVGAWGQLQAATRHWEFTQTGRIDDHDREGRNSTWRSGVTAHVDDRLSFYTAAGTAFRAPSLFELYDATYGNPDVQAQRSRMWEVGVRLDDSLYAVTLSYFRQNYQQIISFDPNTFVSANAGGAVTEGIEYALRLGERQRGLRFDVSVTVLTTDDTSGAALNVLPESTVRVAPTYAGDSWWATITLDAVDQRQAFGTPLPGYTLIGAVAGWTVAPGWDIYARGDNLSNEQYVVNPGYATPGINGALGIAATF